MSSPPLRGTPPLTLVSLAEGVAELTRTDPRLARIVRTHGLPPLWSRRPGFRTLVRIVLEQQVSLASAATLCRRLDREIPGGLGIAGIGAIGERGLRRLGVTRQKASYLAGLAAAVREGSLDLRPLPRLDDDAARAALVAVKGIGPWTAAIYLLMALRRADIWPRGDLALHVALARLRRQRTAPASDEAERYARRWRPWRAIAARILWHDYLRSR